MLINTIVTTTYTIAFPWYIHCIMIGLSIVALIGSVLYIKEQVKGKK